MRDEVKSAGRYRVRPYTLQLIGPDGSIAWARPVPAEHVEEVAKMLQENLGAIRALKGGMDVVRGIQDILDGVGQQRRASRGRR